MSFFPGGKGANQAAAAAQLSYPTHFLGKVGSDSYAAPLRAALAGAGVLLDHLQERPGPTGTAVILLQSSGENSIIIVGGANQDEEAWSLSEQEQQLIAGAGAVLLQREIPEAANIQVAKVAAAAGVPVLLDAGGIDAPLSPELLQYLSIISPNETELQRLTGLPTGSTDEQLAAAAALQEAAAQQQQQQQQGGGLQVLLKLGTAGSMMVPAAAAAGGGGVVLQPAVKAPQVVDTTGAGDCFTAAFMVGLLEGASTAAAMRLAAAAAAICVSRAGAQPSMPSRAELDSLLATLA
ncbi:hypothetical protein OEZ85_008831 [Tetradesmus obliquus]|uniref:Carbohydrate kinase PfkB domain-containing protein n=1 Tax=Tetradesmus obliquus TaxID=3088 RepID=A0ABY8TM64_TETOB|nr:hypothetical protein OEZ85_008831 [Tetradesmus obliquus]